MNKVVIVVGNLFHTISCDGKECPLAACSRRGIAPNAAADNDMHFSVSTHDYEKRVSMLQARLAMHGRQLNPEPNAPPGATWFRVIGKEGRAGIFLNVKEVEAFLHGLDHQAKVGGYFA